MRRIFLLTSFVIALLPATALAGGACRGVPVTEGADPVVELRDACFTPTIVRVDLGQEVTWINRDGFIHAVTGANSSWGNYDELHQGDRTTHQFVEPGVYPYFCFYHPGMTGAVVVGEGQASSSNAKAAASAGGSTANPGAGAAALALSIGLMIGAAGAGTGVWVLRKRKDRKAIPQL
ncbi:MAG: plastocyanin/azurin family copper-binding protein [Actinomycetota bacterium]